MKMRGAALTLPFLVLVVWLALGSTTAPRARLQCLRSSRSTDLAVCLSCHDGSLAVNFKFSVSDSAQSPCGEHPVPVLYTAAYARRPAEFVPPAALDPQIRLIHGE